jgi:hypothetical protein
MRAISSILPRPDGSVDGSSNQHTGLRKSLLDEMALLRSQIQAEDAPFEVISIPGDGLY